MGCESKVCNQMFSYDLCIFKSFCSIFSSSWMALFALLLLFSSYLLVGFGFLSLLYTSMVVIFSTFLYIIIASKQKKVNVVDKLVEEKFLNSDDEKSNEAHEAQEEEVNIDGSESESQDHLSTSEGSEVDHSHDYSDGSISDEESLIEIALPSGNYVDMQKDESDYYSLQQKKKKLFGDALFSQQSLMELLSELNEVNEEENFIEIDISMGSIKYSRFEIEA
jgi:hypothetical protein